MRTVADHMDAATSLPAARLRNTGRNLMLFGLGGLLSLVLLIPTVAEAQDRSVTWIEESRIELPGSLGAFMQALPGAMETRSTPQGIHIMGNRLRHDHGSTSTIMDLDEGRWITIDHDDESYVELRREDIGDVAQAFAEVAGEIQQGLDEVAEELQADRDEAMAQLRLLMDEASAEMDFRLTTRSTGERRDFEGFSAERHVITAIVDVHGDVQGVEDSEGGSLVFLVEVWQSETFPSAGTIEEEWAQRMANDPEFQELGRELAESFEPIANSFGPEALAMWDPRIAGGLDRLSEVFETLQGTTVRSVTNVAIVPEGAQLDEGELFAWEPASMGDQLRDTAGGAAREAAQDAARGAISGLSRGLLGRGGGAPEPAVEEEPTVRPLLRSIREVVNVQQASVSPEMFEPTDGYTARDLLFEMDEMLRQFREAEPGGI